MLQLAPHPASIADVGGSIRASSACSQDQVFTVPVGRVNAAFVPFARPSLRALVVGRSNRRRVVAAVELSLLENIAHVLLFPRRGSAVSALVFLCSDRWLDRNVRTKKKSFALRISMGCCRMPPSWPSLPGHRRTWKDEGEGFRFYSFSSADPSK